MIVVRRCLALATLCVAAPLAAQDTTRTTGGTQPAPAAPAPQPAAPSPLNFSGVIFGSFNYQLPTTPAPLPNQINNMFVVDRAYLNFRIAAGDRTSIRITTDVFPSPDSSSNAYTVRAKYAYLQYEAPRTSNGAQVTGRVGILQNVIIDHMDASGRGISRRRRRSARATSHRPTSDWRDCSPSPGSGARCTRRS